MTFHIPTVQKETPGLEVVGEEFEEGGRKLRRAIQRTPVGEIYATWEGHWNRDFLLKSADDYRVMTWIARNTTVEPAYDAYEQRVAGMPAWQAPLAMHSRTPYQSMLVDLAGLEEFAYHQAEFPEVVDELYDALLQLV